VEQLPCFGRSERWDRETGAEGGFIPHPRERTSEERMPKRRSTTTPQKNCRSRRAREKEQEAGARRVHGLCRALEWGHCITTKGRSCAGWFVQPSGPHILCRCSRLLHASSLRLTSFLPYLRQPPPSFVLFLDEPQNPFVGRIDSALTLSTSYLQWMSYSLFICL